MIPNRWSVINLKDSNIQLEHPHEIDEFIATLLNCNSIYEIKIENNVGVLKYKHYPLYYLSEAQYWSLKRPVIHKNLYFSKKLKIL